LNGCAIVSRQPFNVKRTNEGLHAAYPQATLARLGDVKRRYDPGNLFRSNLNVRPAPSAASG